MNPLKNPNTSKHFWHITHIHTDITQVKTKRLFLTKVIARSRFKNSQRPLVVSQATWRAEKRCLVSLLQRYEAPSVYSGVVMSIGVHQWHKMIGHRFVFIGAYMRTIFWIWRHQAEHQLWHKSLPTPTGTEKSCSFGVAGRPKCEADVGRRELLAPFSYAHPPAL